MHKTSATISLAVLAVSSLAVAGMTMQGPDPARSEAKCRVLGYRGDHLAACVRAFRADYCGDGTAHTMSGVLIDVFDDSGVQHRTSVSSDIEAEWGLHGAVCVSERTAGRGLRAGSVRAACVTSLPRCVDPVHTRGLVTTAIPR